VVVLVLAACGGTDVSNGDGAGAKVGTSSSGASGGNSSGGTTTSGAGSSRGGSNAGGTRGSIGGVGGTGGSMGAVGGTGGSMGGSVNTNGGSVTTTGGSGGTTAGRNAGGGSAGGGTAGGANPECPDVMPDAGSPCVIGVGVCNYNRTTGCKCLDKDCLMTDPSCPASGNNGGNGARMAPPMAGDAGLVAPLSWTACACTDTGWICR